MVFLKSVESLAIVRAITESIKDRFYLLEIDLFGIITKRY